MKLFLNLFVFSNRVCFVGAQRVLFLFCFPISVKIKQKWNLQNNSSKICSVKENCKNLKSLDLICEYLLNTKENVFLICFLSENKNNNWTIFQIRSLYVAPSIINFFGDVYIFV